MRRFALAALLALAACSHPVPPQGRWEGTLDSADMLIAARLEIEADGQVRVSAPDLLDVGPDQDRDAARRKLASDLAGDWDNVQPRAMEFDGETFRKPGGIAPQMVWKAKTKEMWLVMYIGTRPSLRMKLRAVDDFSDDPWTG
jgi:hypothetical protein